MQSLARVFGGLAILVIVVVLSISLGGAAARAGTIRGRVELRRAAGPFERRPNVADLGASSAVRDLSDRLRSVVYLDSAPAKPIDAYVLRVDPQASFTPENTYFREDRVKQVVGVKLRLKGALGFAKPGMPADGEILVDGNDWPTRQAHR